MKIINATEFLKMPSGTVFAKYKPCIFGDLRVKGETYDDRNDFVYAPLTLTVMNGGSDDLDDKLEDMQNNGTEEILDIEEYGRDGMYDTDQLYAVYSKDDIKQLVVKLSSLI